MTDAVDTVEPVTTEKKDEIELPPLQAAARRLERLLGGGLSDKDKMLDFYTNPVKVVRRWLGTSSGAADEATAEDVKACAAKVLDPNGPCAGGYKLLVSPRQSQSEGPFISMYSCREVESWLLSLAVRILWKQGSFSEALELSNKAVEIMVSHLEENSFHASMAPASSLFPLVARMYRLRALVAESINDSSTSAVLRQEMAHAYNMATLRRDVETQATLLNCMMRDLLKNSQGKQSIFHLKFQAREYDSHFVNVFNNFLVEQAEKLLSNSTFPETASNNQLCRYLYYSGRIQAMRLEYTSSYSNLSQCLRKAPTNTGIGFRIAAQRLLIVVQLLMGEIPERHVFFTTGMKQELGPYLSITQAVRCGDLAVFTKVISEQSARLQRDGTYTLISRLAHQVVKAGLRKLHMSYSRLSLQDVADRLGLPSAKSAEYVVAKAVRDGVLDATIHHEEGYVQSHDLVDVYATKEPTEAFHRRIAYCLTTHNDAVKGMRYPPDAYKKQLEASRGNRRKRGEEKTDEELEDELDDEL